MLGLGVVDSEDAFYSRETGVDWDVIFLLLGMMIIVSRAAAHRRVRVHRDLGGQARQGVAACG